MSPRADCANTRLFWSVMITFVRASVSIRVTWSIVLLSKCFSRTSLWLLPLSWSARISSFILVLIIVVYSAAKRMVSMKRIKMKNEPASLNEIFFMLRFLCLSICSRRRRRSGDDLQPESQLFSIGFANFSCVNRWCGARYQS